MKLAYVVLTSVSLFIAFMSMQYLQVGLRELLTISWVVIAIYCMYLFAKPETKRLTSEDRQREYRQLLMSNHSKRRKSNGR